ncbi:nuclear autoantigen Sp-100-like isoform X3 [Meriones unguiculatus]|uniref:nuclear autoantigen Sp-100-like isoform X3 n=1 Tax=Meriones unguiculatus TaxID=10047 RepID=UPI00293E209F|nr:nuclear autoantigen Sp-100-like isoform X3 [Meriones unguiculatus]
MLWPLELVISGDRRESEPVKRWAERKEGVQANRMSTNHKNTKMFSNNAILQYFKKQKLVISYAIKKPFPFLEGLRDHDLITDKMYDDFKDSCRNLVPLHEVIYRALEELEKNFNMTVLQKLFCEVNMENYPHLEPISKSFNNVFPNALCFEGSDRGGLNSHLSLEQGPGESCSQGSLTWSPMDSSSSDGGRRNDRGTTTLIRGNQTEKHQPSEPHNRTAVSLPENGLSEDLCEAVQISRLRRATTSDSTDKLGRKQATIPQGPGSEPEGGRRNDRGTTTLIRGNQTEKHQPSEPHNRTAVSLPENGLSEDLCEAVQISRLRRATTSDSTDKLGRKQATIPQGPGSEPEGSVLISRGIQVSHCSVDLIDIKKEESSSLLYEEQQTRSRTNNNQESGEIVISSEDSGDENNYSEDAPSVSCQPNTRNIENNPTSAKDGGTIMMTGMNLAFQRGRDNLSQRGRKRGPRIPRQNADFSRPVLPVRCGKAEGKLHREKFEQGIYEKSIENEKGQWFTPPEFEIEGKHENSKKWRQSIRCFGWTLQELIKEGKLPDPPRKRKKKENPPNPQQTKKKLENSETCTVCRQRRKLYPCANCRKPYHKKCHIPPVEDESGQWCCVFCKTETNDQLRCQGIQACHKESGVQKRKMSSKDQLRCEQLLLTIYCYPISAFFIPKPKQRKEDFPDLQKHMWLNKIKNRLNKKAYHSVQSFVRDMRLIFRNHSIFYKDKFKTLGVTVGSIFEENFERIFSNKDPGKRLQACNHIILLT